MRMGSRSSVVLLTALAVAAVAVAPSGGGTRAANALAPVPCDVPALVDAINAANTAGSGTIKLTQGCVYLITAPATVSDGLPAITGAITINGAGAAIARDESASAFRLITVNPGAKLTLKRAKLENGNTPSLGGGIQNLGTLVADQVVFDGNRAGNGGGLTNQADATATISKSTFSNNTTTAVGGGGLIAFGKVAVKGSTFVGNSAPINGGGMNIQPGGDVSISDSAFLSNTSGSLGGGLSNLGTLTIVRSTIRENTGSGGGGIATGTPNVFLTNTKVKKNFPDNCNPLNTITGCTG